MAAVLNFDALGTSWAIELHDTNKAQAALIAAKIGDQVSVFENNYSRFISSSYIGQLNQKHTLENPPPELLNMLNKSLQFFKKTDGVFNISVGGQLEKHGYGQGGGQIANNLLDALRVSKQQITTDASVHIDLGGIGKGWLIDKLAKLLGTLNVQYFLINGGGDIYVCGQKPMTLAIEHPFDKQLEIGQALIQKAALATSSANKRSWKQNQKSQHHIINPKTGQSFVRFASISVYAEDMVTADVMATVLLLANDRQRQQLTKLFKFEYLAVASDGNYIMSPQMPVKMHNTYQVQ